MQFPSQHIQFLPLERLIPFAKNPRTHSHAQIAQIAESMQRFGFTAPLLLDSGLGILAGHGRFYAAQLLKLSEVPVIIIDCLSEAEKRAYMVADNKLALLAGWDDINLHEILAGLDDDLRKTTGFSEEEFEQLAADLEEKFRNGDEDAVPDIPEVAVSMLGDLWTLSPHHRLLCGDATSKGAIEQLMAGERAAMTFTDPPWNVDYLQRSKAHGPRRVTNDDLGEGFGQFLYEACLNILAVTDGAVYVCMAGAELHTLFTAFTKAGGYWSTFLIWTKDQFVLGRADYQRGYEPVLYGWRRGAEHFWCGARNQSDVWHLQRPRINALHPTAKPIELVERAIVNSSRPGDIVLDPFAGSGSTLIACEKNARHARLIELEPIFVDTIVRRWEQYTGKTAVLKSQGKTFSEVAQARARKAA